ncbi:hypothetical protein [Roseiarcus sp.]|uniref:hypothetical protein n=1 Tax=Roseiarcus sp. TaxID=1969460 RepID=UPI003F9975E7
MALIWIASRRDVGEVREAWPEWWEDHTGWRESYPGGWTLGPLKRPEDYSRYEGYSVDPRTAVKDLWAAHETHKIASTGISQQERIRRLIRPEEWCDLKVCGSHPAAGYFFDGLCPKAEMGVAFRNILVPVKELLSVFPAKASEGDHPTLEAVVRDLLQDNPNLTQVEAVKIARERGVIEPREKIRAMLKSLGGSSTPGPKGPRKNRAEPSA